MKFFRYISIILFGIILSMAFSENFFFGIIKDRIKNKWYNVNIRDGFYS